MDEADASLVVDMCSVSSKRQPCEISECGNMVTLHSRVVPNIAVQYGKCICMFVISCHALPVIVTGRYGLLGLNYWNSKK